MHPGEKLKQARLEAGLSQRQLCGERITRNMLSLIENGSATPSMDTLQYLAQKLGRPVSYFLEETAASANQVLMEQLRNAPAERLLDLLSGYAAPDPVFDRERYLLEALSCLSLAEAAISEEKFGPARSYLAQAARAGKQTPYYTEDLQRRHLLCCYRVGQDPSVLLPMLPEADTELLLRSEGALQQGDFSRAAHLLQALPASPKQQFLLAEAYFGLKDYKTAATLYQQAEAYAPDRVYSRLEHCCRELEDYKQAYFYACKQRKGTNPL